MFLYYSVGVEFINCLIVGEALQVVFSAHMCQLSNEEHKIRCNILKVDWVSNASIDDT